MTGTVAELKDAAGGVVGQVGMLSNAGYIVAKLPGTAADLTPGTAAGVASGAAGATADAVWDCIQHYLQLKLVLQLMFEKKKLDILKMVDVVSTAAYPAGYSN